MVQSIVVAFDFGLEMLAYRDKRTLIEERAVRLLKYRISDARDDIVLQEV